MRVAELQIGYKLYELRGFFIIGIASSIFCSGSLHSVVAVFPKRSCFIYYFKDLQWCAQVVIWSFHVFVLQRTARNCSQVRVARAARIFVLPRPIKFVCVCMCVCV